MTYIAPSLLAANFANLALDVQRVEDGGAEYLHLDVMDGAFVPNISFGAGVISALRKHSKMFFDVHLMIMEPIRYLDDFITAGADGITVHLESCENCREALQYIKDHNVRVGLAISPDTPWDAVLPYLDITDMVLVMTVHPGFGGQSLIPETLLKAKEIRKHIHEKGLTIDLQVDGGIGEKNAAEASACGANILVAGSAVFKSPDPAATIANLKRLADSSPFRT